MAHDAVLRHMIEADLSRAFELSSSLGWPHRLDDWKTAFDLGMGIVAVMQELVVGTIISCRHGADLATIGMVLVDSAFQGQGIGHALMNEMMAQLNGCSIVLQATPDGASLYSALGFRDVGILYQHQGPAPAVPTRRAGAASNIYPLTEICSELAAIYSKAAGGDRSALLRSLVDRDRGIIYRQGDHDAGFSFLRRFGWGSSIGPVIAPDSDAAKTLILYWLEKIPGSFVRADLTDAGLSEWLSQVGLPKVDEARTMVHGKPWANDDLKLLALTAQSLG